MEPGALAGTDPAEEVARVATARRSPLLRFYRRRLGHEDLEDAYSQATLELVARSRRSPFESRDHVANALELRFKSRIEDRRRAIEGRSPIESAMARAVQVDGAGAGAGAAAEIEDRTAAVERQVLARTEMRRLREVIADLTRDQQLVLASQVLVDMEPAEFCARHDWTVEKYRKVAQRARGKLRSLVEEYERGERCRRLEPDVLALCAGIAEGDALARARAHLANCPACARTAGDLDRAARSVAALLPLPVGAGGVPGWIAGLWGGVARRAAAIVRHPLAGSGGSGGAGVAGGSLAGAGAGALKVGIAAICVAGAAGGYAACAHLGVLAPLGIGHAPHHVAAPPHHASRAPRRHRTKPRVSRHVASPNATTVASTTTPPATVTTTSTPSSTSIASSTSRRAATGRRRLTAVRQTRLEFGQRPGGAASASNATPPSRLLALAAVRVARSERAQVAREFGGRHARVAAAVTTGASGSGTASVAATPAASQAPPAAAAVTSAAPAQATGQARQTKAEFGFEK